jgi:hypothetical protein
MYIQKYFLIHTVISCSKAAYRKHSFEIILLRAQRVLNIVFMYYASYALSSQAYSAHIVCNAIVMLH